MYQDAGFVLLENPIELDMNGHNIDLLHIRNQNGTVVVHDGTISNEIDGQEGDYTAYCGIVVLENMVVPDASDAMSDESWMLYDALKRMQR